MLTSSLCPPLNFLTCCVLLCGSPGNPWSFWWWSEGRGGISTLVREGMRMISHFRQNPGVLKHPKQSQAVPLHPLPPSFSLTPILPRPPHPPDHASLLWPLIRQTCVPSTGTERSFTRLGICLDTNNIILKPFNPRLFIKHWFPGR